MKKIILGVSIFILIFGATLYFYNNITSGLKDFQQTNIGSTLSEIGKQVFAPEPLQIKRKIAQVTLLAEKIIVETNLQRQENGGLPELVKNSTLNEVALAKANDLFKNQYFEHVSPSGVGPGELAKEYGYDYILEGENLILGNFSSEAEAVQDWMDSPGHRANILNNRYTEIGVAFVKGIYKGESVWIGVQEFGLPLSTCDQPNEALKSSIPLNEQNLNNMSAQISQIKNQIESINPKSDNYNQLINQYNELVSSYNDLANQTKQMVADYNTQVNNFNNCITGK